MRRILPFLLALSASAAMAQDFEVAEEEVDFNSANIVVTGSRVRSEFEGYSASVPLVGYQRQADFLLQPIRVTGDTRDARQRVDEVYQTIGSFLRAANAQGFTLAYGDVVTTDVTSANLRDLPLGNAAARTPAASPCSPPPGWPRWTSPPPSPAWPPCSKASGPSAGP
jgi:hypothetical protein